MDTGNGNIQVLSSCPQGYCVNYRGKIWAVRARWELDRVVSAIEKLDGKPEDYEIAIEDRGLVMVNAGKDLLRWDYQTLFVIMPLGSKCKPLQDFLDEWQGMAGNVRVSETMGVYVEAIGAAV